VSFIPEAFVSDSVLEPAASERWPPTEDPVVEETAALTAPRPEAVAAASTRVETAVFAIEAVKFD